MSVLIERRHKAEDLPTGDVAQKRPFVEQAGSTVPSHACALASATRGQVARVVPAVYTKQDSPKRARAKTTFDPNWKPVSILCGP